VPLASARQHPETQKENQAGHSSERTVEGSVRVVISHFANRGDDGDDDDLSISPAMLTLVAILKLAN